MSDDLVKRLRGAEGCIGSNLNRCRAMEAKSGCICAEAADAIERLIKERDCARFMADKNYKLWADEKDRADQTQKSSVVLHPSPKDH